MSNIIINNTNFTYIIPNFNKYVIARYFAYVNDIDPIFVISIDNVKLNNYTINTVSEIVNSNKKLINEDIETFIKKNISQFGTIWGIRTEFKIIDIMYILWYISKTFNIDFNNLKNIESIEYQYNIDVTNIDRYDSINNVAINENKSYIEDLLNRTSGFYDIDEQDNYHQKAISEVIRLNFTKKYYLYQIFDNIFCDRTIPFIIWGNIHYDRTLYKIYKFFNTSDRNSLITKWMDNHMYKNIDYIKIMFNTEDKNEPYITIWIFENYIEFSYSFDKISIDVILKYITTKLNINSWTKETSKQRYEYFIDIPDNLEIIYHEITNNPMFNTIMCLNETTKLSSDKNAININLFPYLQMLGNYPKKFDFNWRMTIIKKDTNRADKLSKIIINNIDNIEILNTIKSIFNRFIYYVNNNNEEYNTRYAGLSNEYKVNLGTKKKLDNTLDKLRLYDPELFTINSNYGTICQINNQPNGVSENVALTFPKDKRLNYPLNSDKWYVCDKNDEYIFPYLKPNETQVTTTLFPCCAKKSHIIDSKKLTYKYLQNPRKYNKTIKVNTDYIYNQNKLLDKGTLGEISQQLQQLFYSVDIDIDNIYRQGVVKDSLHSFITCINVYNLGNIIHSYNIAKYNIMINNTISKLVNFIPLQILKQELYFTDTEDIKTLLIEKNLNIDSSYFYRAFEHMYSDNTNKLAIIVFTRNMITNEYYFDIPNHLYFYAYKPHTYYNKSIIIIKNIIDNLQQYEIIYNRKQNKYWFDKTTTYKLLKLRDIMINIKYNSLSSPLNKWKNAYDLYMDKNVIGQYIDSSGKSTYLIYNYNNKHIWIKTMPSTPSILPVMKDISYNKQKLVDKFINNLNIKINNIDTDNYYCTWQKHNIIIPITKINIVEYMPLFKTEYGRYFFELSWSFLLKTNALWLYYHHKEKYKDNIIINSKTLYTLEAAIPSPSFIVDKQLYVHSKDIYKLIVDYIELVKMNYSNMIDNLGNINFDMRYFLLGNYKKDYNTKVFNDIVNLNEWLNVSLEWYNGFYIKNEIDENYNVYPQIYSDSKDGDVLLQKSYNNNLDSLNGLYNNWKDHKINRGYFVNIKNVSKGNTDKHIIELDNGDKYVKLPL